MPFSQKLKLAFLFLLTALLPSACSTSDEPVDGGESVTPQVIFLFSPGGLGDMGYNDCILEGVQSFKISHPDIDVFLYSPPSIEVAERIFSDWMKRPGSNIPVIFTLASSDYEHLVDEYLPQYELTDNKSILLFESRKTYDNPKVHTFQISMYGASYLAATCAKELCGDKRSLVLLGSSTDSPIQLAKEGFIAGLGSTNYDIEYLAADWSGFVMANIAYQRMSEWAPAYGFIFPVAGGSNMGIYRFTREYADSPFIAGMDSDQSGFSHKIVGSLVKHIGSLINNYLTEWLHGNQLPEFKTYGLDTGYVDWQLSTQYHEILKETRERELSTAIAKENEYF